MYLLEVSLDFLKVISILKTFNTHTYFVDQENIINNIMLKMINCRYPRKRSQWWYNSLKLLRKGNRFVISNTYFWSYSCSLRDSDVIKFHKDLIPRLIMRCYTNIFRDLITGRGGVNEILSVKINLCTQPKIPKIII